MNALYKTNEKPFILFLTGQKSSGKSTCCEFLTEHLVAKRVSLASPIKSIAHFLLNASECTKKQYELEKSKETFIPELMCTYRELLQRIGTDFGRELLHDLIWIQIAQKTIERHLLEGYSIIIDDVRFLNEYTCLSALFPDTPTLLVELSRGTLMKDPHVSEAGFCSPDKLTLKNTSTLSDLFKNLIKLLKDSNLSINLSVREF